MKKKGNNAVLQGLLDSKKEYVEYLNDCFVEPMIDCFQRMYNGCLSKPEYKNGKNILLLFQQQLSQVPAWNHSLIMDEYALVLKRSNCSYVPSLIRAILIVCVKVALMTNYSSVSMERIKLRVPAAEIFYHRCLIICASELWKQPYLLYHKVRSIEQQHNLNEIEGIVKKSIRNAIRFFTPIDQLLSNIQLTVDEEEQAEDELSETSDEQSNDEEDQPDEVVNEDTTTDEDEESVIEDDHRESERDAPQEAEEEEEEAPEHREEEPDD